MEDFQKRFVMSLLAYATQRGISVPRLCEFSGITYKTINKKNITAITPEQVNSLWKNASYLANDNLFELHFGESMQLAALGIIGQIVQTSNTVGEALSNAGSLTHLLTDMFQLRISHTKKNFKIILIPANQKAEKYPFTYRHMAEYLMVFIVHELDGLLLEKIEPLSVQFAHNITDEYEYSRVFRCRVKRNASEFAIEFESKILALPVLSANYELQNYLLRKINILLKGSTGESSLQTKIYNYLLTNSFLYSLSLESVAANFNMSIRSLQRKLKDEGITFVEIVDSVRKALAISYLESGSYSLKDIAYILGYNELSAFSRAFKRWTGKTPGVHKKELKSSLCNII